MIIFNTDQISSDIFNKCLDLFITYLTKTQYDTFCEKENVLKFINSNEIKLLISNDNINMLNEKFSKLDFEFVYFHNFLFCLYLLINNKELEISFDDDRKYLELKRIIDNNCINIIFRGTTIIFNGGLLIDYYWYPYSIDMNNIYDSLSEIIKKVNIVIIEKFLNKKFDLVNITKSNNCEDNIANTIY